MSTSIIPIDGGRPSLSTPLFDIVDHLSALMDSYEGLEDPALRAQCEAEIQAQLLAEVQKVDNIADYVRFARSQVALARSEAKRQQEKAQTWEQREERLLSYVQTALEFFGKKNFEGKHSRFVLQGIAAKVEIIERGAIPEEFLRVSVEEEPDKTAIKKAIEAGGEVPGAKLVTGRKTVVLK